MISNRLKIKCRKQNSYREGGGGGQSSSGAICWSSKYGGINIMGFIYSEILI